MTTRRVRQLLRALLDAGYIRIVVGGARGKVSKIHISDFEAEEAVSAAAKEDRQKSKRTRSTGASGPKEEGAPVFATLPENGEIQRPQIAKSGEARNSNVAKSGAYSDALQHVRDYWDKVWRKDWRYLKDGRRPHINDIRNGIGVLHFRGDDIPDFSDEGHASGRQPSWGEAKNPVSTLPTARVQADSRSHNFEHEHAAANAGDSAQDYGASPVGTRDTAAVTNSLSEEAVDSFPTEKKRFVPSDEQVKELHESWKRRRQAWK